MPFVSKNQMKAAFSGGLGSEMKAKAKSWAQETPNIKSLPVKVQNAQKPKYRMSEGGSLKK